MDPETQRRILEAARAEFLQHGYEASSVNRIIQSAGINKGSLYYYFEDKADLFVKVIQDAQEEMIRSVADLDVTRMVAAPPQDFWGYLERASLQKVEFAIHHPELTRLSSDFLFQASKPGAPPRFKSAMQQMRDMFGAMLKMGQDQGAVRTDLPLDLLIDLGMAISEVMNRPYLEDVSLLENMGPDEIQRYVAPQLDMLRRVLHVPKGGTPQ
jgi:AcrR family transcriptional regulator